MGPFRHLKNYSYSYSFEQRVYSLITLTNFRPSLIYIYKDPLVNINDITAKH